MTTKFKNKYSYKFFILLGNLLNIQQSPTFVCFLRKKWLKKTVLVRKNIYSLIIFIYIFLIILIKIYIIPFLTFIGNQ